MILFLAKRKLKKNFIDCIYQNRSKLKNKSLDKVTSIDPNIIPIIDIEIKYANETIAYIQRSSYDKSIDHLTITHFGINSKLTRNGFGTLVIQEFVKVIKHEFPNIAQINFMYTKGYYNYPLFFRSLGMAYNKKNDFYIYEY